MSLSGTARAVRVAIYARVSTSEQDPSLQLDELTHYAEALGIDLIVPGQAIDTSTPTGRLLFNMLGAIRRIRARSDPGSGCRRHEGRPTTREGDRAAATAPRRPARPDHPASALGALVARDSEHARG